MAGDSRLATRASEMVKTRRTSAIFRRRGRTNPRSPGPGGPSWSRHLPRGANGHSFLVAAVSARPPPGSYKNFHSSWTTSSLRTGDCATQRGYWLRRLGAGHGSGLLRPCGRRSMGGGYRVRRKAPLRSRRGCTRRCVPPFAKRSRPRPPRRKRGAGSRTPNRRRGRSRRR